MSLENLKAGDEVVVRWSGVLRFVRTVQRLTPTQVVVLFNRAEIKFNRRTGRCIGWQGHDAPFLIELTPELRAEIVQEQQKQQYVNKLRKEDWQTHSLDVLQRVCTLLEE